MIRKGWWEVLEDGKHGAQGLGDLYGGVGPWNCPFHAPEGGLVACPYGQGHCGDSGSSWLWKMPLSFTSMTSIPLSRTGDSGSRENRKLQGPNLSALVFLLFFWPLEEEWRSKLYAADPELTTVLLGPREDAPMSTPHWLRSPAPSAHISVIYFHASDFRL